MRFVKFYLLLLTYFISMLISCFNQCFGVNYRHLNVTRSTLEEGYFQIGIMIPFALQTNNIQSLSPQYSASSQDLSNLLNDYNTRNNGMSGGFTTGKFGFNFAYGHKTNSPIRYDFAFEFMNASDDISSMFKQTPFRSQATGMSYTGMSLVVRTYSLIGNLYWDFDNLNTTVIPYVGVGTGLMSLTGIFRGYNGKTGQISTDTPNSFRTDPNYLNIGIVGQIEFGARWKLTDSVKFNLSMKHFMQFQPNSLNNSYTGNAVTGGLQFGL